MESSTIAPPDGAEETTALDDHLEAEAERAAAAEQNGFEPSAQEPEDEEAIPQEPIQGRVRQMSLFAGGEEPTAATMKLKGGSIPVEGEFEKGERITLTIEAVVGEVAFVDTYDSAGEPTSTERRHVARIVSARRA